MAIKIIYFVRHGQTILNAKGIRQGAEGGLTEEGRRQAIITANKFPKKKGKPQVMIVSPFQRTKETAEIIENELHIGKIEYNELLVERRNPSEIIGHSRDEIGVRRIVDRIDNGFHEDNLRYSDEENFPDLRDRAKKLLKYLSRRREQRIMVVTHSIFMTMTICYMLLKDKLTASEYNKLSYLNPINNAGLTICTCETRFLRKPKWKLLVWNDRLQADEEEEKL